MRKIFTIVFLVITCCCLIVFVVSCFHLGKTIFIKSEINADIRALYSDSIPYINFTEYSRLYDERDEKIDALRILSSSYNRRFLFPVISFFSLIFSFVLLLIFYSSYRRNLIEEYEYRERMKEKKKFEEYYNSLSPEKQKELFCRKYIDKHGIS